MKKIFWVMLFIVVWALLLFTPSGVAKQKGESHKEKQADVFCCRVVTKGERPGQWMTEIRASAIMEAMRQSKANVGDYRWQDRREGHYPEWRWRVPKLFTYQNRK